MIDYFQNIQFQDDVINILTKEIETKRMSHAYLFTGPNGCGNEDVAVALGAYITDPEFSKEKLDKANRGVNPDIITYKPQGARGYLASQMKEIVAFASRKPMHSNNKIIIVSDAELLGTSAANAFLKTLEEPPSYLTFILLANNQSSVLPTIVSRCQAITFKSLPYDKGLQYVQDQSGANINDAKFSFDLYGADTSKALEMLASQDLLDLKDETQNILEHCTSYDYSQLFERSKDIVNKVKEILDQYKTELDSDIKELDDVLSNHALKELEAQNKRAVSKKQTELMGMISGIIETEVRYKLDTETNLNDKIALLKLLDTVEEIKGYLSYNVSLQNYCDTLLLKMKEVLNND